ncbi:MAG: ABC transporter ATP-binding protein [Candidatus Marsarchaeota archaeon]|jgi:putative ABC transport system ATP-binding protein|nr:ABC transporter ATP-binding protein [Candidatus Marsarchaeota archaeon]
MKKRDGGPIITLENVKKVYGTKGMRYEAIRGVSLSVARGEFVSILGPSGSGKTTLLDLVGTLDRPTEGEVFINGRRVSSMPEGELARLRNRDIGFVFQSYNLVPYLSVMENVMLPLMVDGRDTAENITRAKSMLGEVGLGNKMQKKPTELSGGEQQRVAIVRALVNNPLILLADEPTGNLDSKTSDEVMNLLVRVCRENHTTIIMVTHDAELTELSDRNVYLRDGMIEKEREVKR